MGPSPRRQPIRTRPGRNPSPAPGPRPSRNNGGFRFRSPPARFTRQNSSRGPRVTALRRPGWRKYRPPSAIVHNAQSRPPWRIRERSSFRNSGAKPIPNGRGSGREPSPEEPPKTISSFSPRGRRAGDEGVSRRDGQTSQSCLAHRPDHHPDADGMWCPWLPFALLQCWPFCWWLAFVLDHHSRRIMAFAVFRKPPTSVEIRTFLGRVIHVNSLPPLVRGGRGGSRSRRCCSQIRPKWPRGSPCARPHALVAGKPGAQFDVEVEHVDGHAHLPIVRPRRAA
jgi:hypothetical protein